MNDYPATLRWLYALEAAKGMDFKLERVELALARLGHPQRAFPSIHVAGTNGKGSVAAMLHAVLGAAGHCVGLYISPHLVRFTERIRVGAAEIDPDEVTALAAEIRRDVTGHGIELTFFELVTVMAFLHFARRRVDVAVVEVGLGGRLDATNVIDPLVAVVTTIGRDHTEYLGEHLDDIAREKGGIIKPGRPVVLGRLPPGPAAVLRAMARERDAPLIEPDAQYAARVDDAGRLSFAGLGRSLGGLQVGLAGAHQRENAATALAVLATLPAALPVPEAAIRTGLANVAWPGRFETASSRPLIVLDGAHNVDGVRALLQALQPLIAGRAVHALFAVMRDKDWGAMAALLAPYCRTVTVTEVLPPRGQPPDPVAEAFRAHCEASSEPEPLRAWEHARARTGADDVLLVTGSLFLIGAIYDRAKAAGRHSLAGAAPFPN